jgi:hypothetical protein
MALEFTSWQARYGMAWHTTMRCDTEMCSGNMLKSQGWVRRGEDRTRLLALRELKLPTRFAKRMACNRYAMSL